MRNRDMAAGRMMMETFGAATPATGAFEDLILNADFLDDEDYAFHARGARPPRRAGRLRAGVARVAEHASVLCLVVFVSLFVPLARLIGRRN
jgi:hypothetical protein